MIEYGKTQTPFFGPLGPETEDQIKLGENKIHFDFQKVIRMLTFRGHEKFDNLFYFKILGVV